MVSFIDATTARVERPANMPARHGGLAEHLSEDQARIIAMPTFTTRRVPPFFHDVGGRAKIDAGANCRT